MTPYARREEIITLLIGGGITALIAWLCGWWALLPAVLTLALLSFYRDPPRRVPNDPLLILAPADGRIVEITPDATDADGRPRLRIMVFLSVLNVHVNRSPCRGRVAAVNYQPGKYLNALNPEADRVNESNTITLAPADPLPGPITVRQIAGVLARRIVCRTQVGDDLAGAQRYGMIKLGSRTEVCLPADPRWEVVVRCGQPVRAGVTVLARWRSENNA